MFTTTSTPMTPQRATRRYVGAFWVSMSLYVVLVIAVPVLIKVYHIKGALLLGLSALPALPLLAMISVMGRYLLETDEYMRALQTKRMMVALAALLGACSIYGFVEVFANAPHLPVFMIFPAFCALWGVTCAIIRTAK
jgi:hypothetical protein